MACYDQMKGLVVDTTGLACIYLDDSFILDSSAGFFNPCTVSMFNMLMNQPADAKIYNNYLDCFIKTIKNE